MRAQLLVALILPALCCGQNYLVTTVAAAPPSAITQTALAAPLRFPTGVTTDGFGNLYFSANQCVFRVDSKGVMTRIAGTSFYGFSGDGGPATNAQLSSPNGLALDAAGNLYVADTQNARIRRIDPSGIITTVAGGGTGDPTQSIPATNAQLQYPYGLAFDSAGDLLIADSRLAKVLKLAPSGIISNFAGGRVYPGGGTTNLGDGGLATAALMGPVSAVAADAGGNVYIGDGINHIRKVDTNGIIITIAGSGNGSFAGDGGPALQAQLAGPNSLALDAAGNIYFSDVSNDRVRMISTGGIVSTLAGGGSASPFTNGGSAANANFKPAGLSVDGHGNLFVADYDDGMIAEISNDIITAVAGNDHLTVPAAPYTSAVINGAADPSVDAQGNRYVTDSYYNTVSKITPAGITTVVAGNGQYCSPISAPNSPPASSRCFSGDGGPALAAQLFEPSFAAVDQRGNLFIADSGSRRIRKVSTSGIITTYAGGGSDTSDGAQALNAALTPGSLAVDGGGNLFFTDGSYRIRKISPNGLVSTVAGTGVSGYSGDGSLATSTALSSPGYLALDASGDIYFTDGGGYFIRELTPTSATLAISAILDAATETAGPLSPGKIMVIYGSGLGPAQLTVASPLNGAFGTQAAGTTVYFNGIAAPILYSSANQVAAIAPYEIAGSTTAQVTVSYQSAVSSPVSLAVAPSAPSFFSLNGSGTGSIAAVNADGSINDAAHPVHIGSYVSLYANGTGSTSRASVDGQLAAAPYPIVALPVTVKVGGVPASVTYAGAAPTEVAGLTQIVIQIPQGVQPGGYVPVLVTAGSASSASGVAWIAVSAN